MLYTFGSMQNNMAEIWKDVVGTSGLYKVSNIGNVMSFNTYKCRKPKMLKANKNKYGYLCVWICVNGINKNRSVHRLVAEAFIENPDNKPCVNHKNSIRSCNIVENLEWVTVSENVKHAVNFGHQNNSLRAAKKVRDLNTGIIYKSAADAAKVFGINKHTLVGQLSGYNKNKTTLIWNE